MNLDRALNSLATRMAALGCHPVGYRSDGRPIWPVRGAEDDNPPADPPKAEPPKPPAEPGFPAGTPIEQMTIEQREAYWKHQSRRWEERAKPFKDLTPEKLAELQTKAERADKLDYDLSSEHEKALSDAKSEAATAAATQFVPQIVAAKLDAAAARKGIDADALSKALEFVDHEKFLNESGEIDTAKVQSFIDGIAPAKGNQQPPKGPSLTGHGAGGGSGSAGRERGLEEARKRFPELAEPK